MAERRRGLIRLLLGLIVVVPLIGWPVYSYVTRGRRPLVVDVVVAERGDVVQTVTATSASVQPRVDIVVASQRSGRVAEMRAHLGEAVRRGDVIAVLDDEVLERELEQATVDVEQAGRKLARARLLSEEGLIPRADLESAEYDHQAAVAKRTVIEARRFQMTIHAPMSGMVTVEHIHQGELLGASAGTEGVGRFPIVTISSVSRPVVKAQIDEVDIPKIRVGQQAVVTIEALGNRAFAAAVSSVAPAPAVSAAGTAYETVLAFTGPVGSGIVAGLRAEVRVTVARAAEVVRAPREAIFSCGGRRCVVLVENGQARRRVVSTGISDASRVEVRSGLSEGEPVIVGFPADLAEGVAVMRRPNAK